MTFVLPANVISDSLSGQNAVTQTLAGLGILPPQWGIFSLAGASVIAADTVVDVEYRQDWAVADAPQERGAFTSYDKVASPFDARLAFAAGGSLANRRAFLRSIKKIAGDLNLYDVVTPEETYLNCNVSHYDYRRADGAAGIVKVSVHLVEIRETGEAALSNTAQPDGAGQKDGGQVQTTDTPAQHQVTVAEAVGAGANNP